MVTHVVTQLHASFDPTIPPAVIADPGDMVSFTTDDSTLRRLERGDELTDVDYETLNLVAGPTFVRGAEPGDSLEIEVLDVSISSAWVVWMEGFGPLGEHVRGVGAKQVLAGGVLDLGDGIELPLDPMIGCVGLAPAHGTASTMRPVYPGGGNLDLRELRPGTRISLPVSVEGALLSIGDLHATQGRANRPSLRSKPRVRRP